MASDFTPSLPEFREPEPAVAEPRCHVHAPPVAARGEARTRWVVILTTLTMVAELVVGYWSRSLALTADGWHMMTHAGALGLSALAYWYARTRAQETRFAFGTGKVYALAGYTSAGLLIAVALSMIAQAIERFINPAVVDFRDAFPVAVVGLGVNLVSAWLLNPAHAHGATAHHDHDHESDSARHGHHHDHNLRAAYLHVVADALTSLAAIAALLTGRYFGWGWFDPTVAIVGALVISRWSWSLVKESARQLVDLHPADSLRDRVRSALQTIDDTRVEDLHLWRVGPGALVCVVSVSASRPRELAHYKQAVFAAAPVDHLTIEICAR